MSKAPLPNHPLSSFDNQVLPAFIHKGRRLFMRVLTNPGSVASEENFAAIKLLGPVVQQTAARMIKDIEGADISWVMNPQNPTRPLKSEEEIDLKKWAQEEFPQEFGKENNYTAIILEDENRQPLCALSFTINDEKKRDCLRASKEAPFIYFDLSQTKPELDGQGFMKIMRSYLLPNLLLQAGFPKKIYMANSMKRLLVRNPETAEIIFEKIPNIGPHGAILAFIDPSVSMLARFSDDKSKDFSVADDHFVPVQSLFVQKLVDEEKIQKWIEMQKAAHPEKILTGCFMLANVDNLEDLVRKSVEQLFDRGDDGKLIIKDRPAKAASSVVVQALEGRDKRFVGLGL